MTDMKTRLDELSRGLRTDLVQRFQGLAQGPLSRLDDLTTEAMELAGKALLETDANRARQYSLASEAKIRTIETEVLRLKIVADAQSAKWLQAAYGAAIDTFKNVAAGVIEVAVAGLGGGTIGKGAATVVASFLKVTSADTKEGR